MNGKKINIIWAVALIAAGLIFLAQELGFISSLTPVFWLVFFSGLSLVFFASYFSAGIRQWGWLIPALLFGGVALTITFDAVGLHGSFVGAPILAGLAIPFLVAYGVDTRNNWWALIPAWVMGVLTVVILLADFVQGELVGTIVLFGIGLPFLFVYLTDRTRWWALIPAGVMGVVGLIPLLSMRLEDEAMGAVVMFLFALPFLVVYLWSRRNWWALIPAGVMATIGVIVLLAGGREAPGKDALITGALFLGWGLTFLALWLRRSAHPATGWAKYPAVALGAVGLLALALGPSGVRLITPIVIIGAGVIVLYFAFRRRVA